MKERILNWAGANKTKAFLLVVAVLTVFLTGTGMLIWMKSNEEETVFRETQVQYGDLTVGVTESGTVAVGTVEQTFALDISEYTSQNSEDSRGGFGMPFGMGQASSAGSRSLEVEELYVSVGQQIEKGDALIKLTAESVEDIRKELVSDMESAQLTKNQLETTNRKTAQEAKHAYEANLVYGEAAQMEYDEAVYELKKALEDAQEALEDAKEQLVDYQEEKAALEADLPVAKKYLEEADWAAKNETDTYWYLENEAVRQEAWEKVKEEEDRIEELENSIFDKEQEIVLLQKAYDETLQKYRTAETDAKTQYDKRMLKYGKAAEIYALATDEMDYQVKVAKEDYEDASEKLADFDAYIVDGVVSAQYDGVITAVSIEKGDNVESDTSLISLNNFDDVTVSVDVEDDDMDSVHVGDTVNLYFSAFPEEAFTGTVSDMGDAAINSSTSEITYAVEVQVEGNVSALYGGMSAEVTFITKETKEVTYVSNRAVIREGAESFVKLWDEDGNLETRQVVTGFSDGNNVEIIEGLSEGDVVLIESKVTDK